MTRPPKDTRPFFFFFFTGFYGGSVHFIGQSANEQEDWMPIEKPATTTLKTTLKKKKTCKSVLQLCSSSKTNLKRQKIHKERKANLKKQKTDKEKSEVIFRGTLAIVTLLKIVSFLNNIYAFIDLLNGQKKALKLNGSYMGGRKLKVKMAADRAEYYGNEDFDGCDCCRGRLRPSSRSR
ncbi:hypothetical protein F2Q68_00007571 [Brassica cretica]|uniref:Uncharacterized protein n=1 Tax=Brassica cretica TaxID=69181 RepID=A0A8S9L523_BRACR|nr:hypothetical protein F2Q68_00007571 [Brassica cretica]